MSNLVALSPVARQLFLNPSNGAPATGFKLFTYAAGTTTKLATYLDSTGNTPNVNPIILDTLGECDIWLPPGVGYKFVFAPPTDTDPPTNAIWTRDNISSSASLASVYSFPTTAALLAAFPAGVTLPDGTTASTAGRNSEGDGGGGEFFYKASDTTTADNGGTIRVDAIGRRWYAILQSNIVNVLMFGAKGDGVTNDQPSIQNAVNYVLGLVSGTVYSPKGTYNLSSTVTVTHAKGINLIGDGPDHTIWSAGAFPAVTSVGWWRSTIQGMGFWCNANTTGGAFQLDGETDGSFGVQGMNFVNCIFYGNNNSKYCFTLVRVAGGFGQGSENIWTDCSWFGTRITNDSACFLIAGSNAVQNTISGGNFQSFINGVLVNSGSVALYSVGFQSTYAYQQIALGGADLAGGGSSAGDTYLSDQCRSESFVHSNVLVVSTFRDFVQQSAGWNLWAANYSAFGLGAVVKGRTVAGNDKMYVVTTAGTTGAVEPVWPESGTIADNSVVWTFVEYDSIGGNSHRVTNSQIQFGATNTCASGIFQDVLFSRLDVFNISNGPAPTFWRCFTGGAPPPGNSGTPVQLTMLGGSYAAALAQQEFDFRNGIALFRGANPGGANIPYWDVGILRTNGGNYSGPFDNNTVGPLGGWQFMSRTFAQLTAGGVAPPAGTVYFCSNGQSKTDGGTVGNALAGAGTGCYAGRQGGIWVSMT